MSSRAYLAFEVPPELRLRTRRVIDAVRESDEPKTQADELIEVVVELTRTGLHSYFLLPLERAGVGSMTFGSAKLGVSAAGRSLPILVRRVLGSLSTKQLVEIVDYLDETLIER